MKHTSKSFPAKIELLLVEDNQGDFIIIREMIKGVRSFQGFDNTQFGLTRAASFQEAINFLGEKRFDIILLDLSLPDAQGLETFYSMRAIASNIPIVVTTGSDDNTRALSAVKAGAQDYLVKGTFDSASLIRSINYAIERYRILNDLENLKKAALRSNYVKNEFLFDRAEEVRSALQGIIRMTEKGLQRILSVEQRNDFEQVKDAAFSLSTVINAVSDFSLLELDKLDLNPVHFVFHDFIDQIAQFAELRSNAKGIVAISHIDDNVPEMLLGDPEKIWRILQTFIDNAVSFGDPGGGLLLFVSSNPSLKGENLHFAVSVSGSSIPLEQQQHVFESLAQADTSTLRKYGANGLSLAVSARLAEQLGGKAWIKSKEKQGCAFHFTIPLEASKVASCINS